MKLVHLADLHLGKRVNEFSVLEDQRFILDQILGLIDVEQPDAVILAGDNYDKPVPPTEAVQMLDFFLNALAQRGLTVFLISGNHDSAERTAFGAQLMQQSGLYVSPVYHGAVAPICITDAFGEVRIHLMPFVKPAHVRAAFPEAEITSYTDALACAVSHMEVDTRVRNVLVTHQFVTGATRSDSEEVTVGGTDNVDVTVFDAFDYVALGHIHSPQSVGRESVRYAGTPLKYSFSEARQQKSMTVVELGAKGDVQIRALPLTPLRDMHEIKGSYEELTRKAYYENTTYKEDYMHITLTDEADIPDAIGKLRAIYHNIMKLDYDNARTRASHEIAGDAQVEQKSPMVLFSEFYELQNNLPMQDAQVEFVQHLLDEIWEGKR